MTTMRARRAQRTRQGVLDVARRLFAERGYDATSLQQIADELGVQKANVYYYFKTKSAILDELLQTLTAPLRVLLDELEAIDDPRVRVERLASSYARIVVAAYREGPLNLGDPGLWRDAEATAVLDELSQRALHVVFGPAPTPRQRASLWIVLDLGPALRRLDDLPDGLLVDTLADLCLRVVCSSG